MWRFIKTLFWLFCLVEVFAVNIYYRSVWPREFDGAVSKKCEVVERQNNDCYNKVFTAQQETRDYKEHIKELQNATINDALRTFDPPKICPKPKVIYRELTSDPNNENDDPESPNDIVPNNSNEDEESK